MGTKRFWAGAARTHLVDILDSLARSLRADQSLRQAIFELPEEGAVGQVVAELKDDLANGVPIAVAIERWTGRFDDPVADLAGSALRLLITAGGLGAPAIEKVAATVRDRRALEQEAKAQASQARLSALMVGLLPIGFFLLAASADSNSIDFFFGSQLGIACLIGGLTLDAIGLFWMNRITKAVRW